jgi:hypothetical protein
MSLLKYVAVPRKDVRLIVSPNAYQVSNHLAD